MPERFTITSGVTVHDGKLYIAGSVPGTTNDCFPLSVCFALAAKAEGVGTREHPTVSETDLAGLAGAARHRGNSNLIRDITSYGQHAGEAGVIVAGSPTVRARDRQGRGTAFDEEQVAGFVDAMSKLGTPISITIVPVSRSGKPSSQPALQYRASSQFVREVQVVDVVLGWSPPADGSIGHFSP